MTIVNFESVENNLDELLSSHLFNSIPDACFVLDERFYIVKMNAKAEQYFLFPKEYMMSKCFWEISPQYVDTTLYHVVNQVKNDRKEVNFEFYGATDHESINLIVRDQGQGIALEPQEKIGLPFFTTKKMGQD